MREIQKKRLVVLLVERFFPFGGRVEFLPESVVPLTAVALECAVVPLSVKVHLFAAFADKIARLAV